MKKTKKRSCTCAAYQFPHASGGGACSNRAIPRSRRRFKHSASFAAVPAIGGAPLYQSPSLSTARAQARSLASRTHAPVSVVDEQGNVIATYQPGEANAAGGRKKYRSPIWMGERWIVETPVRAERFSIEKLREMAADGSLTTDGWIRIYATKTKKTAEEAARDWTRSTGGDRTRLVPGPGHASRRDRAGSPRSSSFLPHEGDRSQREPEAFGRYHSDVGYALESLGVHRDDAISLMNSPGMVWLTRGWFNEYDPQTDDGVRRRAKNIFDRSTTRDGIWYAAYGKGKSKTKNRATVSLTAAHDATLARGTRDYEWIVYPNMSNTQQGGEVAIVPSGIVTERGPGKKAWREALRVARSAGPGAGIYSVSRGAWEGWINHKGNYVALHRMNHADAHRRAS